MCMRYRKDGIQGMDRIDGIDKIDRMGWDRIRQARWDALGQDKIE